MGFADFFSSFTSTVYADSESSTPEDTKQPPAEAEEQEAEEPEPKKEEEEEEPEPEDLHPVIRDECKETKCAQLAKHFEHCQEKVQAGQGYKGEDCVEELMMHCIDDCAGPKLFGKLR